MTKPLYENDDNDMYVTVETPDGVQHLVFDHVQFIDCTDAIKDARNDFVLPTRLFYSDDRLCATSGVDENEFGIQWIKPAEPEEKKKQEENLIAPSVAVEKSTGVICFANLSKLTKDELTAVYRHELLHREYQELERRRVAHDYDESRFYDGEIVILNRIDNSGYCYGTVAETSEKGVYVKRADGEYTRFSQNAIDSISRCGIWKVTKTENKL